MKNSTVKKYDEATVAFLALKEGKATEPQKELLNALCEKKTKYYAGKFVGIIDKDDLLGNANEMIWKKADEFDPDKASFSTWADYKFWQVCSAMYGKYTTQMKYGGQSLDKTNESELNNYDILENENAPSPEDESVYKELTYELYECIKKLSTGQSRAVCAVYLKGMKPAEAAAYLNCTPEKLYRDTNRAISRLRTLLEERGIAKNDAISILDSFKR